MKNNNRDIRKIRTAANIGLWGSVFFTGLTIIEHYLSKYVWAREITANEYTRRLFLVIGLVISVVDIALILFTLRRQTPRLRQMDSLEGKLQGYRALMASVYYATLADTVIVSAVVVTTHENVMIMLLLLMVVTLMLNYPNMYKMKTDMGLNEDEMKQLFGDSYIGEVRGGTENAD